MRTLYIRNVPDEVAAGLEKLATQAGLPLSTFALQELTESARRANKTELLNALPSLPIERASILEAQGGLDADQRQFILLVTVQAAFIESCARLQAPFKPRATLRFSGAESP